MGRTLAFLGLGVRQTVGRFRTAESRRLLMTVAGVALAVALMVSVTGIAIGLASGSTVRGDGVDYWIVPEGGSASSVAVSVEGPQLGAVHRTTARLARDDRVGYVTPVQLQILQLRADNRTEYVLAAGIIPPETTRSVIGLPAGRLTAGDPHYANGSYDGSWTGEVVLSQAAAEVLQTNRGARLQVPRAPNRSFTVTAIAQADLSSGLGPVPVVLVHLSELQSITGTADGDQADQILVSTSDPSVRQDLAHIYPRTRVLTRSGLGGASISTSSLPLAVALAALVTAVSIGTLFVATLSGLDILGNRATIAAQAAMGISTWSRTAAVFGQVLTVAGLGGVVGTALGLVVIVLLNAGSDALLGVASVARIHPLLLAYGPVVALLIGVVSAPYPAWLASRTNVLEVLDR